MMLSTTFSVATQHIKIFARDKTKKIKNSNLDMGGEDEYKRYARKDIIHKCVNNMFIERGCDG